MTNIPTQIISQIDGEAYSSKDLLKNLADTFTEMIKIAQRDKPQERIEKLEVEIDELHAVITDLRSVESTMTNFVEQEKSDGD